MRNLWKLCGVISSVVLLTVILQVQAQGSQLYIAYVSNGKYNDDIFLTNLSNTVTYNLTNSRSRDWHPTWSANGTQIAFNSDRDGNPEIYIMNANGSDPRNISANAAVDVSPDWSPMRNEIAFISNRDVGYDLYIYTLETGQTRRLTVDGQAKSDPDWSPTGQEIAYWVLTDDNNAQLTTIHVETGEIHTLIATGQNLWPAWSPDGNQIAFHSGTSGSDDLFIYQIADARIQPLVTGSSNDKMAAWSPGGEQIVFVSDRDGNENLYLMNADGTHVQRLTDSPGDEDSPTWQPLAAEIDFSDTALGQNISVVQGNVDSETQRELGVGEARVFAPETTSVEDVIRVRFELEVTEAESAATPVPTPDIPLRDSRALQIYRFMGARLSGLDLSHFEVYPEQTDYLLEISPDRVNYWEWYLRPKGQEALGRRFLAIEIYLPEVEEEGAIVETILDILIFQVEVIAGEPEAPSAYTQTTVKPDPALGFSVIYADETSLSIVFMQDTPIGDLRIGTSEYEYPLIGDFPVFQQTDDIVPAGTCLFYELANAQLVLPRACRNDNAYNYLLQPADIFWFDDLQNRLLDVIVRIQERSWPCNASDARAGRCDF